MTRTVKVVQPFEGTQTSLLERLESQGEKPYSECRDGYCGTCATELVSGEVEYFTDPLAMVRDNTVLPCCCRPVSDVEVTLR